MFFFEDRRFAPRIYYKSLINQCLNIELLKLKWIDFFHLWIVTKKYIKTADHVGRISHLVRFIPQRPHRVVQRRRVHNHPSHMPSSITRRRLRTHPPGILRAQHPLTSPCPSFVGWKRDSSAEVPPRACHPCLSPSVARHPVPPATAPPHP